MNIDIEEVNKLKEFIKTGKDYIYIRDGFTIRYNYKEAKALLKALEQQQAEIEKLKAESKANLDGWKQARRIIEKMNKRLRK